MLPFGEKKLKIAGAQALIIHVITLIKTSLEKKLAQHIFPCQFSIHNSKRILGISLKHFQMVKPIFKYRNFQFLK